MHIRQTSLSPLMLRFSHYVYLVWRRVSGKLHHFSLAAGLGRRKGRVTHRVSMSLPRLHFLAESWPAVTFLMTSFLNPAMPCSTHSNQCPIEQIFNIGL
jgi:hypothetical protein